jgi:V/A-type H+-transporting ATPase subunit E
METEVTVQSFLEKIRNEGVEEANRAAEEILQKARSDAEAVVNEARERAGSMVQESRAQIEKMEDAFRSAMVQASRDMILGLKQDILSLCDRIMKREVSAALTPEVLQKVLAKAIDGWRSRTDEPEAEVLLDKSDGEQLEEFLWGSLQEEFRKGVQLRPIEDFGAGFQIGEKEGSMFYDFTASGIAQVLTEYLSPRIGRYLDGTAGEEIEGETPYQVD